MPVLTPPQNEALCNWMAQAFDQSDLKKISKFRFGQNLAAIVNLNQNDADVVFDFVSWADQQGPDFINKLLRGLLEARSADPWIRTFCQQNFPDTLKQQPDVAVPTKPDDARWRIILFILAVVCGVSALSVYFFRPTPPVFKEVGVTLDLTLPTESYIQPSVTAKRAPPLGPGQIKAGLNGISQIRQASINGADWYQIILNSTDNRYLLKASVPVWQQANGNLEAIGPISVLERPEVGAPEIGKLERNELFEDERSGKLRKTALGGITWFRVPIQHTDGFFSTENNQATLTQWSPTTGCLVMTAEFPHALDRPTEMAVDTEDLYKGKIIGSEREIQMAQVSDKTWFRFLNRDHSDFEYVIADQAEIRTGAACVSK